METTVKPTPNTNATSKMEYDVFVMIKPGFLSFEDEIVDAFQRAGFILFDRLEQKMTKSLAKKLYQVHSKKDFFPELIDYVTEGRTVGLEFKSPFPDEESTNKAVSELKNKLRRHARDTMRNVIHSSDQGNVMKESKLYFSQK